MEIMSRAGLCGARASIATAHAVALAAHARTMAPTTALERLGEVKRPERDAKAYRRIRLKNGIEALLISDATLCGVDDENASEGEVSEGSVMSEDGERSDAGEEESAGGGMKLAACSVAFDVGYFADSVECEGLSHFLEHMVFMGSEAFPGENYFGEWLNEHWGSDNAMTDSENTVFYFECNPTNLREALDIFSGFFLSPLMKLDSVDREVTAVESEFERVVNNDSVRFELLLSSLARDGHAFGKFGWGNRASLTQSAPYKEGRLRDVLLEHWRRHYHAKRMSIAIVGAEDLDTLESWMVDIFGEMRADGDDAIDLEKTQPSPYADVVPIRVLTTQVKDGQTVSITHELPAWTQKNYKFKSAAYIETLLGHEGHGSLFAELKRRGWASDLRAGVGAGGIDSCSAGALFGTSISLTDEGSECVDDVIELFFAYINMLRAVGPQEWFWNEIKRLSEIDFRFREPEDAAEYTERLVADIRKFAPEDVLCGPDVYEAYKPDEIREIIDLMTPHRAIVVVQRHEWTGEGEGVEFEQWINFPFKKETITPSVLESWTKADAGDRLHYPAQNPYIASDFRIRTSLGDHGDALFSPSIVHECDVMRIWHRLDDRFLQPRSCLYFQVTLPNIPDGAFGMMLVQLFVAMCEDSVNESIYYPAHLAGMEVEICASASYSGFILTLEGLSDKLGELAISYFKTLTSLKISPERFEKRKEERLRDIHNLCLNPARHATRSLEVLLKNKDATQDDKARALQAMTASDLQAFVDGIWEQAHVEALMIGNVTKEEACSIGANVRECLPGAPIAENAWPEMRMATVPTGTHLFSVKAINDDETNSVVCFHFQIGESTWLGRAFVILMKSLMHEKLFDQLRTKETLGYSVSCSFESVHEILGYRVMVESAFHPPSFVSSRIAAFLRSFPEILQGLDDASYEKTRQSVVDDILAEDVNLRDEALRHWAHIVNQKYQFHRGRHVAQIVSEISKQEAADWCRQYIIPCFGVASNSADMDSPASAPHTRHVMIHVHAKNHPIPDGSGLLSEIGSQHVSSIPPTVKGMGDAYFGVSAEFKKNWSLYPQQGCATVVDELIMPELSSVNRSVVRAGKRLDLDTDALQDKTPSLRSQWASDLQQMRGECGASCACRRTKKPVLPFVLPSK